MLAVLPWRPASRGWTHTPPGPLSSFVLLAFRPGSLRVCQTSACSLTEGLDRQPFIRLSV